MAHNFGLSNRQLRIAENLVRVHESEIYRQWNEHFGR
ncbi:MAG: hypothetical protein ACYDDG_04960 [Casimicrobiaceae bacterium]